jgi:DNA-binding NarL/FixJ family response regulator
MPTPTAEPAGPARKTLLVVDDHPLLRRGLTALIESEPGLAVDGAVGTRVTALDSIKKCRPDLVIIDLALGDEDGLDLVKEIKTRYPNIPSLVLSMHDEAVYAERALSAGALGYVTKHQLDETVLGAIRHALAGETYMSEALRRRLAERYVGGRTLESASPMHTLSDRELQVFRLKGQGRTTRQIAGTLTRSVKNPTSSTSKTSSVSGPPPNSPSAPPSGLKPAAPADRSIRWSGGLRRVQFDRRCGPRLLRRCAPRNDNLCWCHCERSEAISVLRKRCPIRRW